MDRRDFLKITGTGFLAALSEGLLTHKVVGTEVVVTATNPAASSLLLAPVDAVRGCISQTMTFTFYDAGQWPQSPLARIAFPKDQTAANVLEMIEAEMIDPDLLIHTLEFYRGGQPFQAHSLARDASVRRTFHELSKWWPPEIDCNLPHPLGWPTLEKVYVDTNQSDCVLFVPEIRLGEHLLVPAQRWRTRMSNYNPRRNGKPHGIERAWDENGELWWLCRYDNGQPAYRALAYMKPVHI